MALYEFEACPFCVKVRRAVQGMGLKIERRDARKSAVFEKELIEGGGSRQVPCLRIQEGEGSPKWLYESSEIIAFLKSLSGTS